MMRSTDRTSLIFRTGCAAAALLTAIPAVNAATIEAASKVERVILYPDAALVTRTLNLDIPAGSHEVMISGLPANIDPASLRIEGGGEAKLMIGSVDLRLSTAVPPKRKAELEARLKALRNDRDRVRTALMPSKAARA